MEELTTTGSSRKPLVQLSKIIQTDLYNNLAPIIALVALVLVMTIGQSNFFTFENIVAILTQGSTLLVMGVGATFVIMMGSIDMSIASVMAFTGIVTARFIPIMGHWASALAIIVGGTLGLINGLIHTKLRIPSFISTLGMSGAVMGLAYWFCNAQPVYILQKDFVFRQWVTGEWHGIPYMVLISLIVLLIAWGYQTQTRFGRYIIAIGAGETKARLSGIPVAKYKTMAFVVSGLCAGLAGVLLTLRISVGSPRMGDEFLLLVVAVVVMGGTSLSGGQGSVLRTLAGTILISSLINGLNLLGIDAFAQKIAIGVMIIIAVAMTIERRRLVFIK